MNHIRTGDWVAECTTEGNARYVYAPAQVIELEWPDSSERMTLATFRRKVKSYEPKLDKDNPRTKPIVSDEHADRILRFWTATGKLSNKKYRKEK